MKKTRMILTALSVFALVGTALAFKAHKGSLIYCGQNGAIAGTPPCPALQNTNFTPDENGTTFCAKIPGTICNTKAITFSEAY